MARYLVVGSGATGVHVAQTLLERGEAVEMVDVGYERPAPLLPDTPFDRIKEELDDPESYFLGAAGEAVVYPAPDAKPYGFPPSKAYVFQRPTAVAVDGRGFDPHLSFARGGLGEAWTGGSYELRDEEFADFPFEPAAMRAAYAIVARRIGISGVADDLRRFSPFTSPYLPPIPMDEHSAAIHARYEARRESFHADGFYLGRSRVAVLTEDRGDRRRCGELGRCLWGCPRGALYTPGATLAMLLRDHRFTYRSQRLVSRVVVDARGRAAGVAVTSLGGGTEEVVPASRIILAAGALASTHIYLRTLAAMGQDDIALPGVMDNRHVMIPFVNLARLGTDVRLASYQYHMLALGLSRGGWRSDVHGQISTLKAASVHPVVHALPFDVATSLRVFRRIRGALGVANIWLADTRRPGNVARLDRTPDGRSRLVIEYGDDRSDLSATGAAVEATRRSLRRLGCLAPRGMVRILPRGSSVHYAGTLPMTRDEQLHSSGPDGSVRGIPGLYVADGAAFPWLPAKNVTYTLMANATRIAALLD